MLINQQISLQKRLDRMDSTGAQDDAYAIACVKQMANIRMKNFLPTQQDLSDLACILNITEKNLATMTYAEAARKVILLYGKLYDPMGAEENKLLDEAVNIMAHPITLYLSRHPLRKRR